MRGKETPCSVLLDTWNMEPSERRANLKISPSCKRHIREGGWAGAEKFCLAAPGVPGWAGCARVRVCACACSGGRSET